MSDFKEANERLEARFREHGMDKSTAARKVAQTYDRIAKRYDEGRHVNPDRHSPNKTE